MRFLIVDELADGARSDLAERGHDCVYEPDTDADQLASRIPGFDVLVVRGTRVTAAAIGAANALRIIVRAGTGTNTIDCEAAAERGIYVCNVPGGNAVAVAELALALLLALDRDIADNVADLRAGCWDKKRYGQGAGILGRDVGVVGLGRVGLAFAERVAACGARVHAVGKPDRDRQTLEKAEAIGVRFVADLPTLARTCDVLSFHVPATPQTRGLLGRELLSYVRPGAIVLNTSRGEIVDEEALIDAMESKGVRAGLDVFRDEPASSTGHIDSRIAKHPNVYGTHHIGASTTQARQAIAAEVVRMVD
jgi:D-3-phosphoglycerate dehydrogenase